MQQNNLRERLRRDGVLAEKVGFNPYYLVLQSELDDPILINEQQYINLAANNYLGLAADPRVKAMAIQAVEEYGVSLCGTPIATGYVELFQVIEQRLAKFVGLDAALLFPSCYQANQGVFLALATEADLILIDHYAHASLLEGVQATRAKVRPFLHNNLEHLTGILEKSAQYEQIFIVTESVFSTEGTVAPLKEIVALAEKYQAIPVVDDSHGIGVLGEHGQGILEHCRICDYQGIYTASLGKALASTGGMIAGRQDLIDYLRYYCSALVYSTALPPASLGGLAGSLSVIEQEFSVLSQRLWHYKKVLAKTLQKMGFSIVTGAAPINSICTGTAVNTLSLAKQFFEQGIFTTPFIEPAVPPNQGKLRLIAGANLSEATIEKVVAAIQKIGLAR